MVFTWAVLEGEEKATGFKEGFRDLFIALVWPLSWGVMLRKPIWKWLIKQEKKEKYHAYPVYHNPS